MWMVNHINSKELWIPIFHLILIWTRDGQRTKYWQWMNRLIQPLKDYRRRNPPWWSHPRWLTLRLSSLYRNSHTLSSNAMSIKLSMQVGVLVCAALQGIGTFPCLRQELTLSRDIGPDHTSRAFLWRFCGLFTCLSRMWGIPVLFPLCKISCQLAWRVSHHIGRWYVHIAVHIWGTVGIKCLNKWVPAYEKGKKKARNHLEVFYV